MSGTRTILALLIACLACGMLLWVLHRPALAPSSPGGAAGRLFGRPLREVDYLLIERDDLRAELRRTAGGWELTQPVAAPADPVVVQRLLDVCERAPRHDRLTAEELELRELSLADFGLLPPRARLVVAGPRTRAELLIGNAAADSNEIFVCFGQFRDVLATSRELLDAIPSQLHDLRDRALYRGDTRRVTGLALRRPGTGFIRLARADDGWRITQPLSARADEAVVQTILDQLAAARIARFIWPATAPAAAAAGPPLFGLHDDEAGVQIQLWEAGDPAGVCFRLGMPVEDLADHVHALTPDGLAVVAVTGSLLRAASVTLDDLRDKRLFAAAAAGDIGSLAIHGFAAEPVALRRGPSGVWEMTAPVAERADQPAVARLLDGLLRLRAVGFEEAPAGRPDAGITNPVFHVDLTTARDSRRLLAAPGDDRPALFRMAFTNETTVYLVPTSRVEEALGFLRRNPAALRDRDVLALKAGEIRGISVRREDGRTERLERDSAGLWHAADPGRVIDRPALESWLGLLGGLRAERVAGLQPQPAASTNDLHGFSVPFLEVTLDLAAEHALRRVLRVGGTAPGGGRYAKVQGRDAVFVLSPESVRAMEQPLTRPAEPPPPVVPALPGPPPAADRQP